MIRRLVLSAALMAAASAFSQVVWLEREYDFGLMKEIAGPKTGKARFVNQGDKPVIVAGATPSCGCTAVTFPHDPVAPGDTAVITFTYDPAGRPGRFDKSVKVRFTDGQRQSIRIIGNVLGTPESLAQFYPVDAGPIRLSEDRVFLGNIAAGKAGTGFVNICNQRADSVGISLGNTEPSLRLTISQKTAGPGDIVTVGLYFDTHKWGKPGPFEIPLTISGIENGEQSEPHTVRIAGTVIPQRQAVGSKELEKAPRCAAAPPMADLGSIPATMQTVHFTLLNEGKSPLDISGVWTDSPALTPAGVPERIKPGKTASLEMKLDGDAIRKGPFRINISVASNDPANPVLTLNVAGIRE